jgi:hypothetical protein
VVNAGVWVMWTYFSGLIGSERSAREILAAELAAFKLEATRTFATPGAIEKSEERLAIAIDRCARSGSRASRCGQSPSRDARSGAKTGTWSMWGQRDAETMCLLAGGEGWQPRRAR